MKRVLVIGGAGFIGSHLVDRLVLDGMLVRVLDRTPPDMSSSWIKAGQVEYIAGDFVDHSAIDAAVKDVDVVYHLVSTTIPATSNIDPIFDVQSNLVGTVSFLKAGVAAGIEKVIFVSSGGTVYGKTLPVPIKETAPTNPTCSYGITKLAIEKYLSLFELLHGLEFVVFRLANPFGEKQRSGAQGAIAAFMQRIATGQPIEIWGDGSIVRDYIYIDDVTDALVRGLQYKGQSRIFNVGSGEGRSLNEIIETLRLITGRAFEVAYTASRSLDVPRNVLDISLAKQELGWKPKTEWKDGLRKTWGCFQK